MITKTNVSHYVLKKIIFGKQTIHLDRVGDYFGRIIMAKEDWFKSTLVLKMFYVMMKIHWKASPREN